MKGLRKRIRNNPYLRWLLVLSNWIFQGIPYSDKTEKIYKIIFSLFFITFFFFLFYSIFNYTLATSVIIGILIGHTINWSVNGNFFNIIIHRLLLSKLDKKQAFNYLNSLSKRLEKHNSVLYATTHGSICNGDIKPSSDIDVALIRKKGFFNAIRSLLFVVKERKIADSFGIPLEIYLCDSPEYAINRFKNELNPVVLYDPNNTIDKYYTEKLSISEAKELNGL